MPPLRGADDRRRRQAISARRAPAEARARRRAAVRQRHGAPPVPRTDVELLRRRVELAARVPAHRVVPERLDEVLPRGGLGVRTALAVRPDRLARIAGGLLDLEARGAAPLDVLAGEVGGLEEVRALGEDRAEPVGGLVRDLVDAVDGLAGSRRLDDDLEILVELLLGADVEPVLVRQCDSQGRTAQELLRDEDLAQAAFGMDGLFGQGLLELVLVHEPLLEQDLAEWSPGAMAQPVVGLRSRLDLGLPVGIRRPKLHAVLL